MVKFVLKNYERCIKKDEICITNDEIVIKLARATLHAGASAAPPR